MALRKRPHPERERSEQSPFETPPGGGSSGDARHLSSPMIAFREAPGVPGEGLFRISLSHVNFDGFRSAQPVLQSNAPYRERLIPSCRLTGFI